MGYSAGIYTPGDTTYLSKNVRISIDKVTEAMARKMYVEANKRANAWKSALQYALNKKVSESIIQSHARRPDAPFPHYNTGNLRDSIRASVSFNKTPKNYTIGVTMSVGYIGGSEEYPYGSYTNAGFRQRKDGSIASWVGWLDRVTLGYGKKTSGAFKNRSGNEVTTMSKVIDSLITMRMNIGNVGSLI